jgi:hypothetical protein
MNREQAKLLEGREGNPAMDFIGRFESLTEDWAVLQNKLGISSELPHLKATDHRPYRSYYNQELIEEVASMYPRDIQLFGYDF